MRRRCAPASCDHGDTETVTRLLRRLDQRGTGADRQRALFTSASTPAFITALARATLSGYEPGPLAPARCLSPGSGRRAPVASRQQPLVDGTPGVKSRAARELWRPEDGTRR
jgi:hypothetical protein